MQKFERFSKDSTIEFLALTYYTVFIYFDCYEVRLFP